MKVLALDAALGRCMAAVVAGSALIAERNRDAARGHPALLPLLVGEVLDAAGLLATDLDLVAVTVGPGSFTGIRTAIALAQGMALGLDVPIVGVTVGEALAESLAGVGRRPIWSAIDSRRGRVFLERDGTVMAFRLDELPVPGWPIAACGNAAAEIADRLAAQGADVLLTEARLPGGRSVAQVGARRYAGELPPLAVQPLYVDPPEARLPAGGLRPCPRL